MQRVNESYPEYIQRISQDPSIRIICLDHAYSCTLEQAEKNAISHHLSEVERRRR